MVKQEFLDGKITLYNCDCLDFMANMQEKVDLILTDPPYLILNTQSGSKSELSKSIQKMNTEIKNSNLVSGFDYNKILNEFLRMGNNNIYIWCNKGQIPIYFDFFCKKDFSFDIIKWVKTNAMPLFNNKYLSDTEYCLYFRKNSYCQPNSYEDASTLFLNPINQKDKQDWKHPTIKPLAIICKLIRNSSQENELIFDPFSGSGTTAVACIKNNRKFIGCELNNEYFDIACKRIENELIQKSFL
jgi:site-specific DNA-methyltransferase (adenine-specific)